jgi:hypothetical protein
MPIINTGDSECVLSAIFLSSSEAQTGLYTILRLPFAVLSSFVVVNALWRGDLVQKSGDGHNVDCKSQR